MPLQRRPIIDCVLVFVSALAIYLALPTKNYYWDGLIYGDFLEKVSGFGPQLFHPNHLLYNFLGFLGHRTATLFDPGFRALYALQYVSIVFGALCAAIFYSIVRNLFASRRHALAVTGLLAFSAGWWRFSTDANVYIISIAFVLLSFFLAYRADRRRPYLAACSLAMAMLFHQLAIFFLPAFFLALLADDNGFDRRNLRRAITGVAIATAFTAAAFATAYLLTAEPATVGFLDWITQRAAGASPPFGLKEAIYWAGAGTRRLFIDGSAKLVGRDPLSIASVCVFVALSTGLVISIVLGIMKPEIRKAAGTQADSGRTFTLVSLCVAWIVPYVVFLMIVMPEGTFYRLFYLPPLILLLGTFLTRLKFLNARPHTLSLLVAAFAMYNFTFYIYPNSYVREGSVLEAAFKANAIWTSKTRIVYDPAIELDGSNRLLAYFNPDAKWVNFGSLTDSERTEIFGQAAAGEDIWIQTSLLESYPEARIQPTGLPPGEELAVPQMQLRIIRVRPASN